MSTDEQLRSAEDMLRAWPSDEDVECLTGVSLVEILEMRAAAASAAYYARKAVRRPPPAGQIAPPPEREAGG